MLTRLPTPTCKVKSPGDKEVALREEALPRAGGCAPVQVCECRQGRRRALRGREGDPRGARPRRPAGQASCQGVGPPWMMGGPWACRPGPGTGPQPLPLTAPTAGRAVSEDRAGHPGSHPSPRTALGASYAMTGKGHQEPVINAAKSRSHAQLFPALSVPDEGFLGR